MYAPCVNEYPALNPPPCDVAMRVTVEPSPSTQSPLPSPSPPSTPRVSLLRLDTHSFFPSATLNDILAFEECWMWGKGREKNKRRISLPLPLHIYRNLKYTKCNKKLLLKSGVVSHPRQVPSKISVTSSSQLCLVMTRALWAPTVSKQEKLPNECLTRTASPYVHPPWTQIHGSRKCCWKISCSLSVLFTFTSALLKSLQLHNIERFSNWRK